MPDETHAKSSFANTASVDSVVGYFCRKRNFPDVENYRLVNGDNGYEFCGNDTVASLEGKTLRLVRKAELERVRAETESSHSLTNLLNMLENETSASVPGSLTLFLDFLEDEGKRNDDWFVFNIIHLFVKVRIFMSTIRCSMSFEEAIIGVEPFWKEPDIRWISERIRL